MAGREKRGFRILAAALCVLLLCSALPVKASAANQNGLVVDKLSFRDILRLYTADRAHFGADALATDENGVSNAAKNLAEMFAYTVGLNYTGEGYNYNYFGKDISKKMGSEPYTEANLLATYSVEILPVRSRAQALPEGETTRIRVYLAGYKNAANGVEPVLHYAWQENGSWLAVKDDNPYYRVSYNGQSAAECPYTLVRCHSQSGTAALGSWERLAGTTDGTVVQLSGSTLVAGTGGASVFALTADWNGLQNNGGLSSLMAVSDYVRGDTTYQTGPLIYSRDCVESGTSHVLATGETLRRGVSYRFRVVFDEALVQTGGTPQALVHSQVNGRESAAESFVWYGASEYLTSDKYNPHTVEFSFTPNGEGQGVCSFSLQGLAGSESRLTPAQFHICVDAGNEPAIAPTAAPAPAAEAPATEAPAEEIPAAETTAAPTAAPTPAPTQVPTPASTPVPAATPSARTEATTLPLLTAGGSGAPVTRGMLAQSLWVLSGRQVTGLPGGFTDMSGSSEMDQAVIWAAATGLISGRGDGSFGVNSTVTREEAACILWRYAALKGLNIASGGDLSPWADGGQVSGENRTAVRWAVENGLLPLRDGNSIAPGSPALCGEVTGMIYRLQRM